MVTAENFAFDRRVGNFFAQSFRDQKIIDTPTRIILPRFTAIMPPSVSARRRRIQMPKRVDKARVQQVGKFFAFGVAETRALVISFGVP